MENSCQNCNQAISENFCSNCGQKKYKRIDKKYIWDEIQYTFLHINKGFLYSVKSVLKNPGKTAREFIEGNRVNHYKPISLAFVLAGISAFLSINVIKLYKMMEGLLVNQKLSSTMMEETLPLVNKYNSFIMLLFVPIVAVFTKIVFKKWGHNYYEHVVMNAFGVSFYLIACILILYPVLYIFKADTNLCLKIVGVSFCLVPCIMIAFFKSFYNDKPLKTIILRILLMILLLFVCYIVSIIAITILMLIFKGPEGMKYLQAK
jgi:Protein of unknown function (DUF3667)